MINKKIFFSLFFLVISQIVTSQVRINEMTKEDKKLFEKLAKRNIKELGDRIKIISSVKDAKIKEKLISGQARHFIKDSKIEVGWIDKKTKKLRKKALNIKSYLRNEINKYQTKYDIVDIEFISFKTTDLKPNPNKINSYYFDYTVVQKFSVKKNFSKKNTEDIRELNYDYQDKTTKGGRIYIQKKNTVTGSKWKLLFGNISVMEVKVM